MKKLFLPLILVLTLCTPAYAQTTKLNQYATSSNISSNTSSVELQKSLCLLNLYKEIDTCLVQAESVYVCVNNITTNKSNSNYYSNAKIINSLKDNRYKLFADRLTYIEELLKIYNGSSQFSTAELIDVNVCVNSLKLCKKMIDDNIQLLLSGADSVRLNENLQQFLDTYSITSMKETEGYYKNLNFLTDNI